MILIISKYLMLVSLLVTTAWFFWNPTGWEINLEPVAVFLVSLVTFITLDHNDRSKTSRKDTKDSQPTSHDALLFVKLMQALPSGTVIDYLSNQNFLNRFRREHIEPISRFVHEWKGPEYEFNDESLETARGVLYKACCEFRGLVAQYTSVTEMDLLSIRPDSYMGDTGREQEFEAEAEIINSAADRVVNAHKEIIRLGRKAQLTSLTL